MRCTCKPPCPVWRPCRGSTALLLHEELKGCQKRLSLNINDFDVRPSLFLPTPSKARKMTQEIRAAAHDDFQGNSWALLLVLCAKPGGVNCMKSWGLGWRRRSATAFASGVFHCISILLHSTGHAQVDVSNWNDSFMPTCQGQQEGLMGVKNYLLHLMNAEHYFVPPALCEPWWWSNGKVSSESQRLLRRG